MMRVGEKGEGKWRRVSWDEALDFIADKMQKIKAEHGAEAVAFGRGTGINNTHIVSRLANLFGTPNITSIAYFCYGPRVAVSKVTATGTFSQKGWDTTPIADFYGKPACIVQWGSQKRTSNDHGLIGHTPLTDALKPQADQHHRRSAQAHGGRRGATSGCRCGPPPMPPWRSAG